MSSKLLISHCSLARSMIIACLCGMALAPAVSWGQFSIIQQPPNPGPPPNIRLQGISLDGSSFTGTYFSFPFRAFRWRNGVFTTVTSNFDAFGHAISGNGDFVTGIEDAAFNPAFRWSQAGGFTSLGFLPGGQNSTGRGISGDGSIVVGESQSNNGLEAFRWTAPGPMMSLGDLPGGTINSGARGISGDGTTIVGYGTSASGKEAFRWLGGVLTGLGDLPGGTFESQANATSGDGLVAAGYGNSAGGREAFRWAGGVMTGLGDLPGGSFSSEALSLTGGGDFIVGKSEAAGGSRAFFWDAGNGMRDMADFLTNTYGLDLQGVTLTDATGISAAGHVIIGNGIDAQGRGVGWRVVIPEPAVGSFLVILMLMRPRKRRRP